MRLQRELQVQDVIYDVLKDLHFADFLILRYGGYEALEATVTLVHIVLQTQLLFFLQPRPGDAQAMIRDVV